MTLLKEIMPVAKNYENCAQLCEPYSSHGRSYVKVAVNGKPVEVRFYTDQEYAEMYNLQTSPKEALGFSGGFITLFKGEITNYTDWFKKIGARYNRMFGWYLASAELGDNEPLPSELTTYRLNWEEVLNGDGTVKSAGQIQEVVDSLVYEPSKSNYIGKPGDKKVLTLMVKKAVPMDTKFGHSTLHIMEDDAGNVFTWMTGAKTLVEGNIYKMSCTIKGHQMYKNIPQTTLTRCSVI